MKQFDVSFCLPVYNVSAYLAACLDSLFLQTQDVRAQIICVDDCSSDDSWDVLQAIAREHSNMICLHNECNRGVSYCRNKAMETAEGKYVWFIDPDDLLCPNVVKAFLENAEKANADVILGNFARVEESFALDSASPYAQQEIAFRALDRLPHPVDANGKTMCAVWAGLFRVDYLKENHVAFREDMIAQEDTLFYYELEQCRPSVIKTGAVCYLYRQRQSSVMHHKSEERIEKYYFSMRIMLEVYLDYLRSEKYRDKDDLTGKIHRSYENVCSCLAQCTDHAFVKKNLKELKALGYYPYPFRKAVFKQRGSKIKHLFDFLLPIRPCFWLAHYIYAHENKKRFK